MARHSKQIPLPHRLQEKWLRLPALLKRHDSPRCFGSALHDASHILIAMPENPEWPHCGDEFGRMISRFGKKDVMLLGSPPSSQNPEKERWLTAKTGMSLWQAGRESGLWEKLNPATDLFFDLNPDFNLLNILICHRLRPAVRFCFEKPYCHSYYNFVFCGSPDRSFPHRLERLNRFLEPILRTAGPEEP